MRRGRSGRARGSILYPLVHHRVLLTLLWLGHTAVGSVGVALAVGLWTSANIVVLETAPLSAVASIALVAIGLMMVALIAVALIARAVAVVSVVGCVMLARDLGATFCRTSAHDTPGAISELMLELFVSRRVYMS